MANPSIGSMEEFKSAISAPEQLAEMVVFLRQLLPVAQAYEILPNRDFLLQVAKQAAGIHLELPAREFIAKRIFAFHRKGLLERLITRWRSIPNIISLDIAISLLDFEAVETWTEPMAPPQQESPSSVSQQEPIATTSQQESMTISSQQKPTTLQQRSPEQLTSAQIPIAGPMEQQAPSLPRQHVPLQASSFHASPASTNVVPVTKLADTSTPNIAKSIAITKVVDTNIPIDTPQPIEEEVIVTSDSPVRHELFDEFDYPKAIGGIELVEVSENEEIQEYADWGEQRLLKQLELLQHIVVKKLTLSQYRQAIVPELKPAFISSLPRILKGVMSRIGGKTQDKYPLMKCKDYILKYERGISAPISIQVFVAYGIQVYEKSLDQMVNISDISELNAALRQFLELRLEQELEPYIQQFRHTVELCQTEMDLRRILVENPVYDESFVTKHPILGIILKVQNAYHSFSQDRANLHKILNQELGTGEVNLKNALTRILEQKQGFIKMAQDLANIHDINGLFKYLQRLKQDAELSKTGITIFNLIVLFLRGHHRISFTMLQTSLNFLAPRIQRTILGVVHHKLKNMLTEKVEILLNSQKTPENRWKKLMQLLHHPQFCTNQLQLWNYAVPVLAERLQRIVQSPNPDKMLIQSFPPHAIPDHLVMLVLAAAYKRQATLS